MREPRASLGLAPPPRTAARPRLLLVGFARHDLAALSDQLGGRPEMLHAAGSEEAKRLLAGRRDIAVVCLGERCPGEEARRFITQHHAPVPLDHGASRWAAPEGAAGPVPAIPPSPATIPPSPAAVPPSPAAIPPSPAAVPPSPAAIPPSPAAVPPSPAAIPPSPAGEAATGLPGPAPPDSPFFLVLAAGPNPGLFQELVAEDRIFYLTKSPPEPAALAALIDSALRHHQVRREAREAALAREAASPAGSAAGAGDALPPGGGAQAAQAAQAANTAGGQAAAGGGAAGTRVRATAFDLYELLRLMAIEPEPAGKAEILADGVREAVGADRAYCLLYDPADDSLWARDAAGTGERRESAAVGLASFALRSGLPVAVPRVADDPRWDREADDPAGDGSERLLAVPARPPAGLAGFHRLGSNAGGGEARRREASAAREMWEGGGRGEGGAAREPRDAGERREGMAPRDGGGRGQGQGDGDGDGPPAAVLIAVRRGSEPMFGEAERETLERLAAATAPYLPRPPATGDEESPTDRDTVGSEATDPNTSGSARTVAMSARLSPPRATATARSHSTVPGSWIAVGARQRPNSEDRARSRPTFPTVSISNVAPACDTTPVPAVSTVNDG